MKVLVTGGAGYIGSHTIVELVRAGMEPVIVDNFSNSRPEVVTRLKQITGRDIAYYVADVTDRAALAKVFELERPQAVIHFAGLKAVGESMADPARYYFNNVGGTATLLEVMKNCGVSQLVFSSSATVYGVPDDPKIREIDPTRPANNYGRTKLMSETMLQDTAESDPDWSVVILRYFNPVGAHVSGLIGEDPSGEPDNLTPYITQVLSGRRPYLRVFGDDYKTPDGTGIRDYVHVMDLARAHVAAIRHASTNNGAVIFNIGAGQGHSVMEMVRAFEKAAGQPVKFEVMPRRAGDIDEYFADPSLAEKSLGWKAELTIDDMCRDAWNWQSANPNGYGLS